MLLLIALKNIFETEVSMLFDSHGTMYKETESQ